MRGGARRRARATGRRFYRPSRSSRWRSTVYGSTAAPMRGLVLFGGGVALRRARRRRRQRSTEKELPTGRNIMRAAACPRAMNPRNAWIPSSAPKYQQIAKVESPTSTAETRANRPTSKVTVDTVKVMHARASHDRSSHGYAAVGIVSDVHGKKTMNTRMIGCSDRRAPVAYTNTGRIVGEQSHQLSIEIVGSASMDGLRICQIWDGRSALT